MSDVGMRTFFLQSCSCVKTVFQFFLPAFQAKQNLCTNDVVVFFFCRLSIPRILSERFKFLTWKKSNDISCLADFLAAPCDQTSRSQTIDRSSRVQIVLHTRVRGKSWNIVCIRVQDNSYTKRLNINKTLRIFKSIRVVDDLLPLIRVIGDL